MSKNLVDYEYPEFLDDFDDQNKKQLENSIEKEKDPIIKELLEKIDSSNDDYEIIELCAQITILEPENFIADIEKGNALHQLKQNEKAEKSFKEAIKKADGKSSYGYLGYGRFLIDEERFQESLDYYDRAISLDENHVSAWNNKGIVLGKLGKHQDAIECYDRAISLDENHVSAWNNKGFALGNLGKYQDAINCFDRAISLDENHVSAWNNKGFALNKLGKHQELIDCCEKVLSLDENNTIAWHNKGVALDNLGKYQDAIDCFDRAISLDENDVSTWYNKGFALYHLGKYQDAIDCCDRAISLDENHVGAWNNKGIVLGKLGKHQDAIDCFEKALSISDNPEIRKALDEVIEKQNKTQKNDENPSWWNDLATDSQRQYIEELGGDRNAPKTKGEASEMITKLLADNN